MKHENDLISELATWIGAVVSEPGEPPRRPKRDGWVFHLFQDADDQTHFALSDTRERLSGGQANGKNWIWVKRIAEMGCKRIGFSEETAKGDIERRGVHYFDFIAPEHHIQAAE